MKFRTEIDIAPWSHPITYDHNIVTLGSCFANAIAERLCDNKFKVTASPTGILFNPESIALMVELMSINYIIKDEDIIERDGAYYSYLFHSSISGNSHKEAKENMQRSIDLGAEALRHADNIIITLGTAWRYRHVTTNRVVANCHKQPTANFSRELMSIEDICKALESIVNITSARITLTVSPVRHIGEGMEDNSLSKALLRVATDIICKRHPERANYFPSYEILIDDLRDYRFYGNDLVHPSEMAVDYIAEKFFEAALSSDAQQLMARIGKVVQAANHRPTNPQSDKYRSFCQGQLQTIESIHGVDLSKEKQFFEQMLQINL
jgi:hypothetical protein